MNYNTPEKNLGEDTEQLKKEIAERWFPKESSQEEEKTKETKEKTSETEKEREKIREEIKKAEETSGKEEETLNEAQQMKSIKDAEGKIKQLLNLAQTKGVYYSVKVAKQTGDPYLIDLFHDILAKEGLFEKFPK